MKKLVDKFKKNRKKISEFDLHAAICVGIFVGIIGSGVLVSGRYVFHHVLPNQEKKDFYEQVSVKADINNDGITSNDEWAKVYQQFGINYNRHFSDPLKDLSIEQMREYMEN